MFLDNIPKIIGSFEINDNNLNEKYNIGDFNKGDLYNVFMNTSEGDRIDHVHIFCKQTNKHYAIQLSVNAFFDHPSAPDTKGFNTQVRKEFDNFMRLNNKKSEEQTGKLMSNWEFCAWFWNNKVRVTGRNPKVIVDISNGQPDYKTKTMTRKEAEAMRKKEKSKK